jgi:branched-chain amino acid transport system substrate-binding protein
MKCVWATLVGVVGVLLAGSVAAQPVVPAEIVVGTTSVLSGTNARSGQEQIRGLQLWVEEVNERGGLLGRRVQLKAYDDRGEFEAGAGLFEKLIAEDRAELLVGPFSAEVVPAAAAVAERHGIPMLAPGSAAAELWGRGYRNLFGLYTPLEATLVHVLDFAKAHGLRRIAIAFQDSAFGREVAEGVRARARTLGLRVVFDESYDKDATDFAAPVNQLRLKRPDAIVVASYLPDAIFFMKKATEQKLSAKIMAFAGGAGMPEFGKALGPDAEGVLGSTQWEPSLKLTGASEFARRYKAKYGYEPGYIAAGGYAAGQVLEAAAKKAGTVEPAQLRKALTALDTSTILGRYRVDAAGRQVGKTGYVVQWIKGERVPVLPADVAAAGPVYPLKSWARR